MRLPLTPTSPSITLQSTSPPPLQGHSRPSHLRTIPLPFADMLNDSTTPTGTQYWRAPAGRLGWGLQLSIGEQVGEGSRSQSSGERGPPSPPPSPSSSSWMSISLDQDGRRVLRRRRSTTGLSPPPSPTRRVKQKFGIGDEEEDDGDVGSIQNRYRLPTPTSPSNSIFPLSPPLMQTCSYSTAPPLLPPPTLRRTSSLSRLLPSAGPLRRRSTTALFKPINPPVPELQLSRSSSDTKGRRASAGWKRELGVLSEETVEGRWAGGEDGSWGYSGQMSYGWQSGEGLGMLMVTNPDGDQAKEKSMDTADEALDAMDTEDDVGVAV